MTDYEMLMNLDWPGAVTVVGVAWAIAFGVWAFFRGLR